MSTIAIMQNDKMGGPKIKKGDPLGSRLPFRPWDGLQSILGRLFFMSTWQVRHKSGRGTRGTRYDMSAPPPPAKNPFFEPGSGACKFYVNIINDNILHCSTTLSSDPLERNKKKTVLYRTKRTKSHAVRKSERQQTDRIFPFAPSSWVTAIINLKFSTPFTFASKFSLNVTTNRESKNTKKIKIKKSV